MADLGLPYQPLNKKLTTISQEYAQAFSADETVRVYGDVRKLASNVDDCVSAIRGVWVAEHPKKDIGTPWRYLDIGCGDGETTLRIIETLENGDVSGVHATIIEPSLIESDLAQRRITTGAREVRVVRSTLEDAELAGGFHLITSVHSFYTIDEAYLRRMYEYLAPGGLACIWIGALENNVVNRICAALDQHFRRGRRNYAETSTPHFSIWVLRRQPVDCAEKSSSQRSIPWSLMTTASTRTGNS